MGVMAAASIGVSFVLEAAVGEPPRRLHPVALFGRIVDVFDRSWPAPRAVGTAVALVLPVGAAAVTAAVTWLALRYHPALGVVVAGLALFSSTSLRLLLSEATTVIARTDDDVEGAREAVRALVGRDASELSAGELRSAAVESLAENLADGFVAPLVGFVVGAAVSLPLAAAAAVWVKAVNTLDSVVGYPSKPVGWASARLDDVVMWLPARLSAVLIALAGGSPGALRRSQAWRARPASPNSGWPMATLAAVLDVRLEKPDSYVLNRDASVPTVDDATAAVRIVRTAGVAAFLLASVAALLLAEGLAWF